MNRIVLCMAIVLGFIVAGPAYAQEPVTDGKQAPAAENGEHFRRNLERWLKMPPGERQKLIELHERWKRMPPEERQRIMENYRRFRSLPFEKQQALLRTRAMMGHLQQGLREDVRRKMHAMRQMPPEHRRLLIQKMTGMKTLFQEDYEELKRFGPQSEEARRVLGDMRTKARALHGLSLEEIERLKNLSPEARREVVRKLIEEWKNRPHPPHDGPPPPGLRRPRPDEKRGPADDATPRRHGRSDNPWHARLDPRGQTASG
jgi:predicted Fe-S protein YdhL (DUF1289 family)